MKGFFKVNKIFIMAALVLAVMIIGVDVVSAASAPNTLQTGSSSYVGQFIGGTYFETKTISGGGHAYCLNIHKDTTTNMTITRSRKMDNGFAYIIKNGYPYKSFTGDSMKDYYITQMAVWLYQDETGQDEAGYGRNLSASFRTQYASNAMAKYVISLVDGALKVRTEVLSCKGETLKATSSDKNLYLSKSEQYYVSKPVTVVSASSYTVSFTNSPSGTFAANSKGEKKSTFNKGETFSVYVPVKSVKTGVNNVKVNINSNYKSKCTSSVVYEYKPNSSSVQTVIPAYLYDSDEVEIKEDASVDFSVTVVDKAQVKVMKVDQESGKGLAGAKLELQDANGKVIETWISDESYHIISKSINDGTYYVVEKEAPKGYVLDNTKHKVVIDKDHREVTVTVKNTKEDSRSINIVKVDKDTGNLIAGAILVVRDSKGNVVVRFETKDTPYVISDIEDGVYTVEEEKAPEGYVKSDEIITITVDNKHVQQTITFTNVKEKTWVPNTASNMSLGLVIGGLVVMSAGIGYIVYTKKKKTNE